MEIKSHDSGEDESHRIDQLSTRLYSTDPSRLPKHRVGMLHSIPRTLADGWKEPEKVITKIDDTMVNNTNLFKRFFIGAAAFFVLALAVAAYLFFLGGNTVSSDNITLNVLGNAYTQGGEVLPLTVEIGNENAVALQDADLIVEYSKNGTTIDPTSTDISHTRQSVGTIDPGKVVHQDVPLTLFGEENSTKQIHFRLEYHVSGSNAIFQKEKDFIVTISSSPVTLSVDSLPTAVSGQPYTMTVTITPNGTKPITNMRLRVEYPTGFEFTSATPSPSYLSSVFTLPDLMPGTPQKVTITGTLLGQDKEERSFRIYLGQASSTISQDVSTVFNSTLQTVTLVKPFLEAHMSVNGQTSDSISVGGRQDIDIVINWANNLPVQILDGQISLQLIGGLLDKSTVNTTNGFYSSATDTVVWSKDTLPAFKSIAPGQQGEVEVHFKTSGVFGHTTGIENPTVMLALSIRGVQPDQSGAAQQVLDTEQKILKLKTDFQVTAQSLYHSGPFVNSGPFPPRTDQKTMYTIKWTLTNTANPVSNVVVRASLPPYVHFLGAVSPSTEDVSVDPTSGDVIWNTGTVVDGAGFANAAKVVYFQVECQPSANQIGESPALLLGTDAHGQDSVTNQAISSTFGSISTDVTSDAGYNAKNGLVTN